jgi:hypothetical protein
MASGFEVMFADIISFLVKSHSTSERLRKIVIDEWDTIARSKRLFNRLSDKSSWPLLLQRVS